MTTVGDAPIGGLEGLPPESFRKNPKNPRRFFNEERLDLLRTSIQEEGVLVPVIAYPAEDPEAGYVLMDGERRWRCAIDLGLETIPTHLIEPPSPLDNLLRMFNIHFTRDDWPLISVALSLREVMEISGEDRESRLSEMTGLTRATVRRAKRLLSMPEPELELIQSEAHLDRSVQVHREDLYLEIEAAESVLRNAMPEIAERYPRDLVIRRFAEKRETGNLGAVTDFRQVGKLVKAVESGLVPREQGVEAAERLIERPDLGPAEVFDETAAGAYEQLDLARKAELLAAQLRVFLEGAPRVSEPLRASLQDLLAQLQNILAEEL